MDITKIISGAFSLLKMLPILGQSKLLLGSDVLSVGFSMTVTAVGFIEALHNNATGAEKKAKVIEFLDESIDLLAIEQKLTPTQSSFLKATFVPAAIELIVTTMNIFGYFTGKNSTIATVIDPSQPVQ